jgi:RNA polymerase sigma factor (sigma-70 family)
VGDVAEVKSPGADDRALLQGCQRGEREAWEALIRRYRRLIYSIPFACGLDADAADDVFQRVATRLVEHVSRIRDASKLAAWIAVTTRREAWAARREGRRSVGLDDDDAARIPAESPDAARAIDLVGQEHAMALALERMEEPCRSLLHYLYVEDPRPSYEEIGRRLGRPIGSLGPTQARCLTKLKRLYQKLGGVAP